MKYRYLNEVLLNWNSEDLQDNSIIKSSDIKKQIKTQFIYKINDEPSKIHIFNDSRFPWVEYKKYKDKVYINGKHVGLKDGYTVNEFDPGEYKIYIEDLDQIKDNNLMFFGSEHLISAIIPNTFTSIGSNMFNGCTNLTDITIPDSIIFINTDAFAFCRNLNNIYITDLEAWCNIIFKDIYSNPLFQTGSSYLYLNGNKIKDLVIPNSITEIHDYAFQNCSGLTSVTIPDSVTSIGDKAFRGCTGLTSVTIPNSVNTIGSYAFADCSGMTSVIISNSVTALYSSVFAWCISLTSVSIPNSVKEIYQLAFNGCTSLTEIYIPKSVKKIYEKAFNCCYKLNTIYVENINRYKRSIGKNTDPVNWNDAKLIELENYEI